MNIQKIDPKIAELIKKERERQETTLEMIPSENHTSSAVRSALGSILTDKYAEGYPGKRYYAGLEFYDKIETICQQRAKKLFKVPYVNVQPYSGSPANQAVYFAVCDPRDTVMGMSLLHGGHLTHGSHVNFSGKNYTCVSYDVDKETEMLDMDVIRKIAIKEQPKMIISGLTAYPRKIDFKAFQEIAEEVNAYHMADISRIAGLIAGGVHQSPGPTGRS